MDNIDKGQFKEMLDTMFELYNKKPLDQNALRVWWHKLNMYPIRVVSQSFDTWIGHSNKVPTPYDIIVICRSKSVPTMKSLPKPTMNPEHKERLRETITQLKSKLGWK